MFFLRPSIVLASLLALSSSSFANDWYVNSRIGSDAHDGTTPGTAWATITHALATVPTPVPGSGATERIHLAPGNYSSNQGESFPLVMRPGLQILGAGSAVTFLDGQGAFTLVQFVSSQVGEGYNFGRDTRVEGMTLRNAAYGLQLGSDWNPVSPTLTDLVVEAMSTRGIHVTTGGPFAGIADPLFLRVTVRSCELGVYVGAGGIQTRATFVDCAVRDCAQDGVRVWGGRTAVVALTRCAVTGCGGNGIYADYVNYGFANVTLEDSLVAGNGGSGIEANETDALGGGVQLTVRRSTVAWNVAEGIDSVENEPASHHSVTLTDSIVAGNGDDLRENGTVTATRSLIEDGDYAGNDGNLAGDPGFRDPAGGDWRLVWGSPAVDQGVESVPDLAGVSRSVDGDLDLDESGDLGAFEFRPLGLRGVAQVGATVTLELHGEVGATTRVYLSRLPLTPIPLHTAFGDLDLDRGSLALFVTTTAAPFPPAEVQLTIPDVPGLIGATFSFQAVTSSPASPSGQALTNAVSFVVGP